MNDLLGDSGSDDGQNDFHQLKENAEFKARYEHNERRKLLEKGKLKYGDALDGKQED